MLVQERKTYSIIRAISELADWMLLIFLGEYFADVPV